MLRKGTCGVNHAWVSYVALLWTLLSSNSMDNFSRHICLRISLIWLAIVNHKVLELTLRCKSYKRLKWWLFFSYGVTQLCQLLRVMSIFWAHSPITTSIWTMGSWHVSPKNLKIYRNGRFVYLFHWCMTIVEDPYVGSESSHNNMTWHMSTYHSNIGIQIRIITK